MSDPPGRRALVIGASRGLGPGLVHRLLQRAWSVTATVRRPTPDLVAGDGLRVESGVDINDDAAVVTLYDALAEEPKYDLIFVVAGVATQAGTPCWRLARETVSAPTRRTPSARSDLPTGSIPAWPTSVSWC